jgi:hypothetical protein
MTTKVRGANNEAYHCDDSLEQMKTLALIHLVLQEICFYRGFVFIENDNPRRKDRSDLFGWNNCLSLPLSRKIVAVFQR